MGIAGTPTKTQGVFDGLCVDGLGNVWVARWADERIIGYTPDGAVICYIWTKGCKSPTIPCFGGTSHFQLHRRVMTITSKTQVVPNTGRAEQL
jgi:sugar lactone lactonase YvrE